MTKRVVLYARVSSEEQAKGDAVSIDSQITDMNKLCDHNNWSIEETFIDRENYRATQTPKKGKVVSPSGERADRPQFLNMLEMIKSGAIDIVLCWRDDRLMRHPRVAVALEDALDVGDVQRNKPGKITLHDATGATIDRFTLSIKAVLWREENKRRSERIKMGKVGVLENGRWPGKYGRYGYAAKSEPGKRGKVITLGDTEHVQTIKDIFNWFDSGETAREISRKLRKRGDWQTNRNTMYGWNPTLITRILRSEDYTGKATWRFDDRTISINIPQIITREQWERVQERIDKNKVQSSRNAKRTFILHHLIECGECGGKVSPNMRTHYYGRLGDGTLKKYYYKPPSFSYRCTKAARANEYLNHSLPYNWEGKALEWVVWRYLIDNGVQRPELIVEQVRARQKELAEQGENVDSEINRARDKVLDIEVQRAFYQRQAARGKITEQEFDLRMAETQEKAKHWNQEIERLRELRDDKVKVQAGLEYAKKLLHTISEQLEEIDVHPEQLSKFPKEKREIILKKQQSIVRALCDKIIIYHDGRIVIEGLLDGSEIQQFDLQTPCNSWRFRRCGKWPGGGHRSSRPWGPELHRHIWGRLVCRMLVFGYAYI